MHLQFSPHNSIRYELLPKRRQNYPLHHHANINILVPLSLLNGNQFSFSEMALSTIFSETDDGVMVDQQNMYAPQLRARHFYQCVYSVFASTLEHVSHPQQMPQKAQSSNHLNSCHLKTPCAHIHRLGLLHSLISRHQTPELEILPKELYLLI